MQMLAAPAILSSDGPAFGANMPPSPSTRGATVRYPDTGSTVVEEFGHNDGGSGR